MSKCKHHIVLGYYCKVSGVLVVQIRAALQLETLLIQIIGICACPIGQWREAIIC
jgi:hypothetical protein